MKVVLDVGKIRNNLKEEIKDKLFSWIDIRNNFNGFGIALLEDIVKISNIGLFTDSISDALKIRNIYKNIPIIISKIESIDQIYDIVMNDLILSIDDIELFNKLYDLNLKDKIQIAIKIDIKNYEEGISLKNYYKIKENLKNNKIINIYSIYTYVNNIKYNNIKDFENLVKQEQVSSFVIGQKNSLTSDGFIAKEIFNDVLSYKITIDKCYKLTKGDKYINKKIKKECYGIKIVDNSLELSKIKSLIIDNKKYKTTYYNDNAIFLVGDSYVKNGKSIDISNKFIQNNLENAKILYKLNEKNVYYTIFD